MLLKTLKLFSVIVHTRSRFISNHQSLLKWFLMFQLAPYSVLSCSMTIQSIYQLCLTFLNQHFYGQFCFVLLLIWPLTLKVLALKSWQFPQINSQILLISLLSCSNRYFFYPKQTLLMVALTIKIKYNSNSTYKSTYGMNYPCTRKLFH